MTLVKDGDPVQQTEVPMAFQSAFAGILLAAHVVAEHLGLRTRLPTKTQINVMTALAPFPSRPSAALAPMQISWPFPMPTSKGAKLTTSHRCSTTHLQP
jgi:hypothetical protein